MEMFFQQPFQISTPTGQRGTVELVRREIKVKIFCS